MYMFRLLLISICIICSAVSADTPSYEDYKLIPIDWSDNNGWFGYSISISGDGSTAIVGASYGEYGAAYIYELVGGTWEETKLTASDGGNYDRFGDSVSISSDGTTAIVGSSTGYPQEVPGSAYIYELVDDTWQETNKLFASDGASNDRFGRSVSISSDGSTVIVGAYDNNDDGTGAAYIYELVGAVWEETKILASDGAYGDMFGHSVSISSDGMTSVVGALGNDDNGLTSGSAYIYRFDGSDWIETKLLPSDGAYGDQFGRSVSISSDGTTIIIGANDDNDNGTYSGSAYIYSLLKGVWQETKLLASDGASEDRFGYSVSSSSDGTTVIIGADEKDDNGTWSGAAYIYELVSGVWEETKLLASDGAYGDYFGYSVSISGDSSIAIVGSYKDDGLDDESGSAYIFDFGDSDGDGVPNNIDNCYLYNPDQADCNENGIGDVCDVADQTSFDCDQNGVPDECQPDCDGDGWIDPCDNDGDCDGDGIPDNCELDCNGNGVPDDCDIIYGISEDCNGNGVPDECDIADGTANDCNINGVPDSCDIADELAFDCDSDGLIDSCAIDDGLIADCNENNIPDSCDIADGTEQDCNSNGVPDSCVYEDIYYVSTLIPPTPSWEWGMDGIAVAGNVLAVGDTSTQEVFIYRFNEASWMNETILSPSDGANGFGKSVAISSDGTTVLVGANLDDNESGSVYIYRLIKAEWEETKIIASDAAQDDQFGIDVSISGDGSTAIIGARFGNGNEFNSGAAYIYKFIGNEWEETKIIATDGAVNDYFGTSISISNDGNTAIVGAKDAAYIFKLISGVWEQTVLSHEGQWMPAVSISGNRVVLGTGVGGSYGGRAVIYQFNGKDWIEEIQLSAEDAGFPWQYLFGWAVSIDGDTVAIGALGDGDDSPTGLYIFEFDGEMWNPEQYFLYNSELSYGMSLSMDDDTVGFGGMVSSNYKYGTVIIHQKPASPQLDCNANGIADECDIEDGTSNDVDGNGVPDECEVDCNWNGIPDYWDIKTGTSEDCQPNGIPDECDIGYYYWSDDWDGNGIPDECEADCNDNGYTDYFDILMGWSEDVNGDIIPDECQCIADITSDNMVDVEDLLAIIGYWGSDGPLGDVNQDGTVDVSDLLIVVGNWGPCE